MNHSLYIAGTTLNLLKFPIYRMPRHMLALRNKRLMEDEMREKERSSNDVILRGMNEIHIMITYMYMKLLAIFSIGI